MLTVEKFKIRLRRINHPDWLHLVIDASKVKQFYIVFNGGMGNTISTPIEKYLPEIKECVVNMLSSGGV